MDILIQEFDERLASLPFPMRYMGNSTARKQILVDELYEFGRVDRVRKKNAGQPQGDMARAEIGEIKTIAARTAPCRVIECGECNSSMALYVAGSKTSYREGQLVQDFHPGQIHLNPRTGGTVNTEYFSGIICEINHHRLKRTLNAMGAGDTPWNPEKSYILGTPQEKRRDSIAEHLLKLYSFIDELLRENEYLAKGLGLDEQIYRLLALSLIQEEGYTEKIERRWANTHCKQSTCLDNLVEYIVQNANQNLTLTDLEEQSHYSGRQLQNLFKEKFDCTPMQFVRKQRLSASLERLETAEIGETVTTIARDMGYRYTSNFCCDFQREFGVTPSVVLRSSRGGVYGNRF